MYTHCTDKCLVDVDIVICSCGSGSRGSLGFLLGLLNLNIALASWNLLYNSECTRYKSHVVTGFKGCIEFIGHLFRGCIYDCLGLIIKFNLLFCFHSSQWADELINFLSSYGVLVDQFGSPHHWAALVIKFQVCIIFQFADRLSAITADIVSLELPATKIQLNILIEGRSITGSEKLVDLQEFVYA